MPNTCEGTIYVGTGWHRSKKKCGNNAKFERDGKWFCGTHDPVTREEKRAKKSAEWNARFDADRKRYAFQMAAMALCNGVPTERLTELGQGWLMAHLEREDDR